MNISTGDSTTQSSCLGGFTRLDLLFTTATLTVLLLLNLAAVSNNRAGSQSAGCLANTRDLTRAWQQYAMDQGKFPPNPDDGNTTPGNAWVGGSSGIGNAQEFNPDIVSDPSRSLLFPYVRQRQSSIFRCPADERTGRYQGADPARRGTIVPAARSYSMNGAVGTDPYTGNGDLATPGHWLDNNFTHQRGLTWRTYARFEDVTAPSPEMLSVLFDEDAVSINDAYLAFGMQREEWIDWPATRHHLGGTVSFADGHAVLHRWVDPGTIVVDKNVARRTVPGSPDYQWVRDRTSALIRP